MTVTLRVPEAWQEIEDLMARPDGCLGVGEDAAGGIAELVDRLLQSLEDILEPGGDRRSQAPSSSPARRLELLNRRAASLPAPARTVMQKVVQEVAGQLLEIRRLGGALHAAVRESDEARRAAEHYAMTDPLTGLLNRRGFSHYSTRAYAQAAAQPVLLLFVDIDQMKLINDRGGHEAGDRAIQVAAEALRRSFRSSDLLVRWGGDEFAVLSSGGSVDVPAAAARIRQQAERVCLEREVRPAVGLSVGGVTRAAGEPCSLDQLMARADEAMYACKQARQEPRGSSSVTPLRPAPSSLAAGRR